MFEFLLSTKTFSQILTAYLQSPATDLGYIPVPVPPSISLPEDQVLQDFVPVAGVPTVRPVYSALLRAHGPVIVKLGCSHDVDHEASR